MQTAAAITRRRGTRTQPDRRRMGTNQAISEGNNKGRRAGIAFCGLFALIGMAIAVPLFFLPLVQVARARSWVRTPCTILSSEVAENPGDDGPVYRVAIRY